MCCRICSAATPFRVTVENVTAVSAPLLCASVEEENTQGRVISVACQVQHCSHGSGGKVPYAAIWHSGCRATGHIIVFSLGRRSWQCACWDAAFSKGWEREGRGGKRADVSVPCMSPWCKCWGRRDGVLGHHVPLSFCYGRTGCSSNSKRDPRPWWDNVSVRNHNTVQALNVRVVITGGICQLMRERAGSIETLLNLDKHPQTRSGTPWAGFLWKNMTSAASCLSLRVVTY